jgi:heavy metal sensor kinase
MRALAWQLTGVGLLVLTVGLAGGWVISARLLRPLAAISATASTLSATNLSGRIDTTQIDRELADLARILNATFARLETAFEQQTRFTADASHELRTPLAIIRTQVEYALARARTPEQYRETMQTCLRASSRMTHLIEELLALARADAGKLDLQQQPVDLQALVEESVALFEPLADINQIHFQCDLQPAEVTGDATRLGQVITNLLSNAIKYNRPGGSVTVTLTRDPQHVVLTVADTGIGIPEEDVPHIFERFYRVDKARSRTSGGNGLGLAICRSIIEAHGGTIRLTTQLNKGSTFWVHLSVQDSALHAQA